MNTFAKTTQILSYILQQISKMHSPNEIDLLSLHVAFLISNSSSE